MKPLSFSDVEEHLLQFRIGRRVLLALVLDRLLRSEAIAAPCVALSRLFVRLKSADSIAEKINRKGIVLNSFSELGEKMPDILGCRIVVETLNELHAINHLVEELFEVVSNEVYLDTPNEFGGRGVQYQLRYHDNGNIYPVALQLRTFLQHYWATSSFHLFHKQPKEAALKHQAALRTFGENLYRVEVSADSFRAKTPPDSSAQNATWPATPIRSNIHLVLVESGEWVSVHEQLPLAGNDQTDHAMIVARKMQLYSQFPGSVIVECSCLNFSSVMFNEPQLRIPADRLNRILL